MTEYDGKEPPRHYALPVRDERTGLRNGVVQALRALPMHFTSPINIEGIEVNDLFSINTLLGGTIEAQTVMLLNSLRGIWDPEGRWEGREFRRYPESFPDVRLVGPGRDDAPLIGIELKGWYLLSKESEPSLRYKASADAVTEWDLICCVPWGLSNVLSGKPVVYDPYVEQAKFASDMRTYYWNHRRGDNPNRDCGIRHPETTPYPRPGTQYVDVPNQDGGGNFGRIARVNGLMADWVNESMDTPMAGIEAKYWVSFFRLFSEGKPREEIEAELDNIARKVRQAGRRNPREAALEERLLAHLGAIVELSLE
ncbi:hypothetical protein [Bifidobacterium myosotis]|uniref:Uncharacterized protein n=1 Tax=Bifidobacterium myosotis TaxID=1630166 RepID=A0A5M9ZHW1_9BIFI|nr:hypothetical protein [Bifidobacterium myosotis]KAA8826963.1 hypothetical protein EMO91_10555 [Bifidobacterium myosotis]